jgi:ABC-type nitrate/sulfonate/bicarbonate transport system substrate-binding protein
MLRDVPHNEEVCELQPYSYRRRWRGAALCLSGVALAASVAACSSSGSSSGSSGSAGGAPSAGSTSKPLSLTIGIPQVNAQFTDAYWAQQKGIWKSLNLNVTISVTGAVETTSLSAGRLVAGVFGTTAAFAPAVAGRAVSIVDCEDTGDSAAGVTVRKPSSYNTLMDLSGQSVGVVGSAGQGYGTASDFSSYIQAHGGKPLKIVVESSLGSLVAATLSGQVAGAIQTSGFEQAIAAGKAAEIVSPTAPATKAIVGTQECSTAYWGLKSQLAANSDAITRFIAGMRIARAQLDTQSDAQVAAVLASMPDFAPSVVSSAALTKEVTEARPFFSAAGGFISPATWSSSLDAFSHWGLASAGLPVDLKSKPLSYPSIIDMSFWNAATPLTRTQAAASPSAAS